MTWWLRRTTLISPMLSFWSNEMFFFFISEAFDLHIFLPWCIAERTQAIYTLLHTLGKRCLVVVMGKSFPNFPKATQHLAALDTWADVICNLGRLPVDQWCCCTSCWPQLASLDEFLNTSVQYCRPKTLSSSCWHGASLPCLELGDTLLQCVRDEHKVMNAEKLPWHTSAEFTLKCFQN